MSIYNPPTHFPQRLNSYVPAMQYAADVDMSGITRIDFGTPIAAAANTILNDQSIATAITVAGADLLQDDLDGTWGRNITTVASGAATSTVTVRGWDYLGQPMTEVLTLNGTNSVVGVKAFKKIKEITFGVTAATTVDVGVGALLGLPFKAMKVLTEELDNTPRATLGTLTSPVLTNPQTSTTGDPRGRYTPNATLTGSARLTATFIFDNTVDTSGDGGLHGIPHYYA